MKKAQDQAFSVPNESITQQIRSDLRRFKHPVRLSARPLATARDVLAVMQTVEAIRNTKARDLRAYKLPGLVENEFYSGSDYEIDFKKNP